MALLNMSFKILTPVIALDYTSESIDGIRSPYCRRLSKIMQSFGMG